MSAQAISFDGAAAPVRDEIASAHGRFWQRLAAAGSWWTGAERVAIAAETRAARACALCAERRQAISPNAVTGAHDRPNATPAVLPAAAVDAVHRITTDATRLSASFVNALAEEGLDDGHYVELLGIVVGVTSVDYVCRGLGAAVHPLPRPIDGQPSHYRPAEAKPGESFVPMIPSGALGSNERDLWRGTTGNVIRAMSLVPDAVRDLQLLSAAHYLPTAQVANPRGGRTLSRPQIELVAGRVSALNECFY